MPDYALSALRAGARLAKHSGMTCDPGSDWTLASLDSYKVLALHVTMEESLGGDG
jgi:hypothetical protein